MFVLITGIMQFVCEFLLISRDAYHGPVFRPSAFVPIFCALYYTVVDLCYPKAGCAFVYHGTREVYLWAVCGHILRFVLYHRVKSRFSYHMFIKGFFLISRKSNLAYVRWFMIIIDIPRGLAYVRAFVLIAQDLHNTFVMFVVIIIFRYDVLIFGDSFCMCHVSRQPNTNSCSNTLSEIQ